MTITLKSIERNMWRSYFDDGSWEILFGIIWLTSGIRSLTDNIMFTWFMALGPLYVAIARIKITTPRIGNVTFNRERMRKIEKVTMGIVTSIIVAIILIRLIQKFDFFNSIQFIPIMGLMLLFIFFLMVYFMDSNRFIIIGIVFFCSELIWTQISEPAGPIFNLISGVVFLIIGLTMLYRFIKTHPFPKNIE